MPRPHLLHLERFLPYRLSVLSNLVSGAIAGAYVPRFGLSIAEWRVMVVLAVTPRLSAAEVVARTAMDKVAVSRAVNALVRSGVLARTTAPHDRRRSVLALRPAGRRVYAKVIPVALRYERMLLAALTTAERAHLDRILDRLQARALRIGPVRPGSV